MLSLPVRDPINPLNEITTRLDPRLRPSARTVWLVELGTVDPKGIVPIAGEDGIPAENDLTTRWTYDEDLTDGAGLDGTFATDFFNDLGLVVGANGSAVLVTSPGGERTLSIVDGLGRTVRTVRLTADPVDVDGCVVVDTRYAATTETVTVDGVAKELLKVETVRYPNGLTGGGEIVTQSGLMLYNDLLEGNVRRLIVAGNDCSTSDAACPHNIDWLSSSANKITGKDNWPWYGKATEGAEGKVELHTLTDSPSCYFPKQYYPTNPEHPRANRTWNELWSVLSFVSRVAARTKDTENGADEYYWSYHEKDWTVDYSLKWDEFLPPKIVSIGGPGFDRKNTQATEIDVDAIPSATLFSYPMTEMRQDTLP